jgi:adenylosuccinate synthase
MPGWKQSSAGVRDYALLPDAARRYVERLADLCGVEIGIVSTGPDRDHTILRGQSALSSWFE